MLQPRWALLIWSFLLKVTKKSSAALGFESTKCVAGVVHTDHPQLWLFSAGGMRETLMDHDFEVVTCRDHQPVDALLPFFCRRCD